MEKVRWGWTCPLYEVQSWKLALGATRGAWELAYAREDHRASQVAATLADWCSST